MLTNELRRRGQLRRKHGGTMQECLLDDMILRGSDRISE
jgi:hypothetical protein